MPTTHQQNRGIEQLVARLEDW